MTFQEWYRSIKMEMPSEEISEFIWVNAQSAALEMAAKKFEGLFPFEWAYADDYANGADIAGELRRMADNETYLSLKKRW